MRRLPTGGRIDRSRPLAFTLDGAPLEGLAGDTVASAALAAGVAVLARSPVLGRPRGPYAPGREEPSAHVQIGSGARTEPMLPATVVELVDGLEVRTLAGHGLLPDGRDPDRTDARHAHCDVLVVGAGPAGLAAALAAARTGARVILADDGAEPGGSLLATRDEIDGAPALAWVAAAVAELAALPDVRVLTRTYCFALHDGNLATLVERRTAHRFAVPPAHVARERLWRVRAREVVVATGAVERPLVFADNDRPGVVLASLARELANRFAVVAERAVVFTATDEGLAAALDLADRGVDVAAIVDARPDAAGALPERVRAGGLRLLVGHVVRGTEGDADGVLAAVEVAPAGGGAGERIACDQLAVSGGWDPRLGLYTLAGGNTFFFERRARFLADSQPPGVCAVGGAVGLGLGDCLRYGLAVGAVMAQRAGFGDGAAPPAPVVSEEPGADPLALWLVPGADGEAGPTHFVDLQRDATVPEIARAVRAGATAIEHVKRYTLIGTGVDQGRTAAVNAAAVAATLLGEPLAGLATSNVRPPLVPVSFGTLAGRRVGELFDPVRVTSIHPWHEANGAVFEPVGQWHRPFAFPRPGEPVEDAVLRECRAAREAVAVMDASTLGKIDVQGPDAAELLDRLYANDVGTIPVGRARYSVICKPDGMVFDDGVILRLAEERFLVTTTTGNAAAVLDWLEEWLQTEWPELRVRLTSVTEQWATVALVGPRSRELLAALAPRLDVSAEGFRFMAIRDADVAGLPARVCRISFSGELAYEVSVPWGDGLALWEAALVAGEPLGITPYGTEAMHVLRAEKGYFIVGQETDGTVTPQDLGLDWLVSKAKPFVGSRSHRRADNLRPDRKQLVGVLPVDPTERLPEGAQLVVDPAAPVPVPMVGHVTSSYASAALGRTFALALVRGGASRHGETLHAPLGDRVVPVTVVPPVLVDPEGRRRDG